MSSSIFQYFGGILETVALAATDAVSLMDAESSLVGVVVNLVSLALTRCVTLFLLCVLGTEIY